MSLYVDSALCLCDRQKGMYISTIGILEFLMLIGCIPGIAVTHEIIMFMSMRLIRSQVTYSIHVEIMTFRGLVLVAFLLMLT